MEKSHVSMAQNQCFTCPNTYDTGEILLDTRLRKSLERTTVVGYGVCPNCLKEYEGRIALVKAQQIYGSTKLMGEVMWLAEDAWERVFTMPKPAGKVALIDADAFDDLKARVPK